MNKNHSMPKKSQSIVPAILLLVMAAGSCIQKPVGDVTTEIQNAIDALNSNSAMWKSELDKLAAQLKQQQSDAYNQVVLIEQKGVGTAGAELQCNADFVGQRMKEDLQSLLATLQGKPTPPKLAYICQVSPTTVDLNARQNELDFYGYNLDVDANPNVVLKHSDGEIPLGQWVNRPTHYLMTVNTAPSNGVPICNLSNRRIVYRSQNQVVSAVDVIGTICGLAPPTDPEAQAYTASEHLDANLGGFSVNHEYGDSCAPQHHRTRTTTERTGGAGIASCNFLEWVDPGNANSCKARVHFGGNAGIGNWLDCRIRIYQEGDQLPPPPCNCK